MARILLVSHDGWRTGAPFQLLWLAQWLAARGDHQLEALLVQDGPLREDFARLCPTGHWAPPPPRRLHRRLLDRIRGGEAEAGTLLHRAITRFQPDLVYLNTLVLGHVLEGLAEACPATAFVSHVHELDHSLTLSTTPAAVRRQLALSDRVIACAPCVRDNLIARHGVPEQRLDLVRVYLPQASAEAFAAAPRPEADSAALLARLDAERQRGTFLFGFTGSAIARKGFDLLPLLVKACAERFGERPFLAVWVGCSPGSQAHGLAMHDLERLGLEQRVLLHAPVASAIPAIGRLSAVSLLSREDPYPVVCLEGAALGVPTVCFEQSGGMPEFVAGGRGVAVPYLDLPAFAEALHGLACDPGCRDHLGQAARERVFRESSIDVAGAAISAVIESVLASRSGAAGSHRP